MQCVSSSSEPPGLEFWCGLDTRVSLKNQVWWEEELYKDSSKAIDQNKRSSEKCIIAYSKENWQLLSDCHVYNLMIPG